MHVVIRQKPTQHCKSIILQLKKDLKKKKKKVRPKESHPIWIAVQPEKVQDTGLLWLILLKKEKKVKSLTHV